MGPNTVGDAPVATFCPSINHLFQLTQHKLPLKMSDLSFSSTLHLNMGVSKNNGIPKSSILIECSIINHPFWDTPIFGNTHYPQDVAFSNLSFPPPVPPLREGSVREVHTIRNQHLRDAKSCGGFLGNLHPCKGCSGFPWSWESPFKKIAKKMEGVFTKWWYPQHEHKYIVVYRNNSQ